MKNFTHPPLLFAGMAAAALAMSGIRPVSAQTGAANFPNKPIRVVVGFPAGGPADFFARTVAQKMTEVIGQQVIVDNRAGVSGLIAAEHVARTAPADGYVVYFAGTGVLTFAPNLYAKLPVDVNKELVPLTLGVTVPEMLAVHPSLPVKTTRELVALAKARPKQIVYGSTGNGGMPHLAVESLRVAAGIELVHVRGELFRSSKNNPRTCGARQGQAETDCLWFHRQWRHAASRGRIAACRGGY